MALQSTSNSRPSVKKSADLKLGLKLFWICFLTNPSVPPFCNCIFLMYLLGPSACCQWCWPEVQLSSAALPLGRSPPLRFHLPRLEEPGLSEDPAVSLKSAGPKHQRRNTCEWELAPDCRSWSRFYLQVETCQNLLLTLLPATASISAASELSRAPWAFCHTFSSRPLSSANWTFMGFITVAASSRFLSAGLSWSLI